MGEPVNIDDDADRWRWVCPAGHRNWEPTNHHFWCQQCPLAPEKEPIFHELHDLRRDRTVGRDDLQPLGPEQAVELYVESRKDDTADWTRTSHTSRLRPFLEWCEENDLDNLNTLDGRHRYEYRIWRRDGNYSRSKVDTLAGPTLQSSLSTLRRFLRFAATVEAVPEALYEKVPIPDLDKDGEITTGLGYRRLAHETALVVQMFLRRHREQFVDICEIEQRPVVVKFLCKAVDESTPREECKLFVAVIWSPSDAPRLV